MSCIGVSMHVFDYNYGTHTLHDSTNDPCLMNLVCCWRNGRSLLIPTGYVRKHIKCLYILTGGSVPWSGLEESVLLHFPRCLPNPPPHQSEYIYILSGDILALLMIHTRYISINLLWDYAFVEHRL